MRAQTPVPRSGMAHVVSMSGSLTFAPALAATIVCGGLGCTREAPVVVREAPPGAVVVVAAPAQELFASGEARHGMGWYPDVEVDAQDRVHLAWTDADAGDVLYAVAPPGSAVPGPAEVVAAEGAAGAFVRLALGPGDAPVISFHHQGDHTLRIAHRPTDLAAMKAAGADVVVPAARDVAARRRWVAEDVAFGRDAGAGSALAVDARGRPHLLYGARGDRVRLARRPAGVPAFGHSAPQRFEITEVARGSGQSPTARNALLLLEDGTEVAAFCDFEVVHSSLLLAVRHPREPSFTVVQATGGVDGFEGTSSALLRGQDGQVDVAFTDHASRSLWVGALDPGRPAPLAAPMKMAPADGPVAVQRARDGTLWVLGWEEERGDGPPAGLFLLEHPRGDRSQARRTLLERGVSDGAWMDLALRSDGRPVAVWFSEEGKLLRLYAP